MKTSPTVIVCRSCWKAAQITKAAKNFWEDNYDIPYVCAKCMAEQIHRSVINSDVAKFEAVTNAYLTLARNNPVSGTPASGTAQTK